VIVFGYYNDKKKIILLQQNCIVSKLDALEIEGSSIRIFEQNDAPSLFFYTIRWVVSSSGEISP